MKPKWMKDSKHTERSPNSVRFVEYERKNYDDDDDKKRRIIII